MDKFTIARFNELFPDEDACLAYIKDIIYPDGITCRKCGGLKHSKMSQRKAYACQDCGTHVYPLAGTIFEKSSTPLKSWLYAMYLMASTRTGISAKQLERELGVTYKTAWRMFSQIRKLLAQDSEPLFGQIEIDESYFGGDSKNRHANKRDGKRGRGATGKTVVVGLIERKGKALVTVAPNVQAKTLLPIIQEHIPTDPQTIIYTDELHSYNKLASLGYAHETVQHAAKQYVNGLAHVNNMESMWSNTKRGIDGVNHAVSPKHLQSYLDAYVFRFNHRKDSEAMYETMVDQTAKVRAGKHGSYSPLKKNGSSR